MLIVARARSNAERRCLRPHPSLTSTFPRPDQPDRDRSVSPLLARVAVGPLLGGMLLDSSGGAPLLLASPDAVLLILGRAPAGVPRSQTGRRPLERGPVARGLLAGARPHQIAKTPGMPALVFSWQYCGRARVQLPPDAARRPAHRSLLFRERAFSASLAVYRWAASPLRWFLFTSILHCTRVLAARGRPGDRCLVRRIHRRSMLARRSCAASMPHTLWPSASPRRPAGFGLLPRSTPAPASPCSSRVVIYSLASPLFHAHERPRRLTAPPLPAERPARVRISETGAELGGALSIATLGTLALPSTEPVATDRRVRRSGETARDRPAAQWPWPPRCPASVSAKLLDGARDAFTRVSDRRPGERRVGTVGLVAARLLRKACEAEACTHAPSIPVRAASARRRIKLHT